MAPTKLELRIPERVVHPPVDAPEEEVIAEVGEALAVAASSNRPPILDEDARQAARRAAVDLATAALTANSAETASHSDDVDIIAEGIGRRLGLSDQQLDDVMVAARLHDIGKLGVPQSIIEKPAALDDSEWAVIKRHTIIGEQILLAVPELRSAARLVRHSHERWDGGGYPDGLSGQQIPIGSRIVFCADAYHAIRSNRAYRAGRPAAEAFAEIRSCAGTQFDPAVVEALEDMAVQLRANRGGSKVAFGRSRRLMALMLVVSVGFTGSAIARSGVIPEAKTPPPAAGAAAAPTSNPVGPDDGFAAPGQPGGPLGQFVPGQLPGSGNLPGSAFSQRMSLLSVMPAGLQIAGAPISGPTGSSPVATEVGSAGSGAASGGGASAVDSSEAESQSNASGSTQGNAKGKAKKSDGSGASETTGSGAGSSGPSSESSSGKSSSSGKGKPTATKTSKSGKGSTSTSTTSDSSTTSSSGKGSGKTSSGNGGGNGKSKGLGSSATTQTSDSSEGSGSGKAPKPPKPPKAPKPPKVTPPPPPAAVPPTGASTGSSGSSSGSSSSGSGLSGSGSNPGGNGNGHGNGHG